MKLKYQNEIDNLKLDNICPNEVKPVSETIYAYRYSFNPIANRLNFLPNVVFDREKPAYFNYKTANNIRKCKRCGSSFFLDKSSAIGSWNGLSEQIRQNLGYTHVAYGILQQGDGWICEPEASSHFSFYEEENADLIPHFKILDEI